MRRLDLLPELLAPAGDMECLYAAVSAGADAVYVGGRAFGARAYAKNFDLEELKYATAYCHIHGVKLYVTVNTLVYDREMRELSDFVFELWKMGVDAVITADLGAIREIKRRAPGLKIHASTQMSVHNHLGADLTASLGCERVVLARELPLEDIASTTEKCAPETEVFLHGALCVCHSGQCLFSSLVGGRSGNRGECAQPCRLSYNNKYPLSLRDLSLAGHINELISSGVASLKIEGRMKAPEYVYTVVSIYRRLLDERREANAEEIRKLREVFSRGDFTDAYFKGRKFEKMTGVRSEKDKELTNSLLEMHFAPDKVRVAAEVKMKLGEPSSMTLILGDKKVTVYGTEPTRAINSPLTEDGVKERLSKMGATLLSLSPEDINLLLDEGINLPPSAINALRRDAAESLVFGKTELSDRGFCKEKFSFESMRPLKTAQFLSGDVYHRLEESNPGALDTFDIVFLPMENFRGTNGVYIPPIVFDSEISEVKELLLKARELGARYALIGNIGHIPLAKEAGLVPIGDFRLNITNSYAKMTYSELGVKDSVLSAEITLPMARDIGGGEIVYGKIPLMITERCFIKENFGCERCGKASFEDRTGAKFALMREFGHRNLLINSRPTYMGDRKAELLANNIVHEHFIFTNETAAEIASALDGYLHGRVLSGVRRIGKREENKKRGVWNNGKTKF